MAFGFGGLGASFPMRYGDPTSQQVMSDSEYQDELNKRLAGISPISGNGDGGMATFGRSYTEAIRNPQGPNVINPAGVSSFLGSTSQSLAGTLPERSTDGINQTQFNRFIDRFGLGNAYSSLRPATGLWENRVYSAIAAANQREMDARRQNQVAQQQAYNGMMGDGQMNAVLGANYSTPGFGQVNGQLSNPYAPNSGEGADMTWSTGVYNPISQTKNSPWGL